MANVDILLNSRPYTVFCEDGQENRLKELAQYVDNRLRQINAGAPGATENRLLVLTCLMLADEILDLKCHNSLATSPAASEDHIYSALEQLAEKIENVAQRLNKT